MCLDGISDIVREPSDLSDGEIHATSCIERPGTECFKSYSAKLNQKAPGHGAPIHKTYHMFVTYPIKRDKLGNQIKSFEFSKIRDLFRFELTRKFVFQKHWTAYGMMVQEGPELENQSLASISSLAASIRICIGFFFSPADSRGSLIFGIRGTTVDLVIMVCNKSIVVHLSSVSKPTVLAFGAV